MTAYATQLLKQNGDSNEQSQLLQLAALFEISSQAVTLDIEPLLGLILDQLKGIVNYTSAAIVALEGDELVVLAVRGSDHQEGTKNWRIPLKYSPIHHKVIHQQEPIIISDIWGDTSEARTLREVVADRLAPSLNSVHSWMGIPLMVKGQLRGMLALFHHQTNYYRSEHVNQVLAFAHHTAMAIENDYLYQQAHYLATLEERERLAREMHDQLAQALGYINLKTSIIDKLLTNEQIAEA